MIFGWQTLSLKCKHQMCSSCKTFLKLFIGFFSFCLFWIGKGAINLAKNRVHFLVNFCLLDLSSWPHKAKQEHITFELSWFFFCPSIFFAHFYSSKKDFWEIILLFCYFVYDAQVVGRKHWVSRATTRGFLILIAPNKLFPRYFFSSSSTHSRYM